MTLNIRKIIVYSSKILGIILCFYYIYNAKQYQISWSLLDWALSSSYITQINHLLSYVKYLMESLQ